MLTNKNHLLYFVLLIMIASVYRIIPGRPWGFAPQIAMSLFSGAIVKEKKYSFTFPLLSMFLSDILYQICYLNGIGDIPGFYDGQIFNYFILTSLTFVGFFVKPTNVRQITIGSVLSPFIYFLISNFSVWISGGGYNRPKTSSGLLQCYIDGLPFLGMSVLSTIFFSMFLFGGYFFINRRLVLNS